MCHHEAIAVHYIQYANLQLKTMLSKNLFLQFWYFGVLTFVRMVDFVKEFSFICYAYKLSKISIK